MTPFHWQVGHINYIAKQMKVNSGYQQGIYLAKKCENSFQATEFSSGWGSHGDNFSGKGR